MDFSGSDICRFNRYRSIIQRWWLLQALRYALNHRRRSLPCFFIARIAFSVRRPPNVQILPIVINPTFFSEATKLGLNISRIVSKLGGKFFTQFPRTLDSLFLLQTPQIWAVLQAQIQQSDLWVWVDRQPFFDASSFESIFFNHVNTFVSFFWATKSQHGQLCMRGTIGQN